jgi:hypothetical protein
LILCGFLQGRAKSKRGEEIDDDDVW